MKNNILFYLHRMSAILLTILIFCFSLMSGRMSSNYSSHVADFIQKFFLKTPMPAFSSVSFIKTAEEIAFERFIRKAIGHYFLFFLLSYFMTMSYLLKKYSWQFASLKTLFYGLCISFLSEFVQCFPMARGPSFGDAFLNFSGYASMTFLLIFFYRKIIFRKTKYIFHH